MTQLFPKINKKRFSTQSTNQKNNDHLDQKTIRKKSLLINYKVLDHSLLLKNLQREQHSDKLINLYSKNSLNKYRKGQNKRQLQRLSSKTTQNKKQQKNNKFIQKQIQMFNKVENNIIYQYYNYYVKNKNINNKIVSQFTKIIRQQIGILSKCNQVICQSLLKLGFITVYQQKQTIYKQKSIIKNLGIILWGECLLKKNKSKLKMQQFPGNTIGEQIIFENINYHDNNSIYLQKGQFLTFQKCKSLTNCGVLYISYNEYKWMSQQMIGNGFKDEIIKFNNIIHRHYLHKKQLRQYFG